MTNTKALIPFLGMYPREMEICVRTKLVYKMFIAELFTIAKKQKQYKCSSVDEWINKI